MEFCCNEFKNILLYFGAIYYDQKSRGKWVCRFHLDSEEFIQSINNCPWCGKHLEAPKFDNNIKE